MKELEKYLEIAKEGALESRAILLKYFGALKKIEEKPRAGLVSEADKESEKSLRRIMANGTPNFDFLGEEEGLKKLGDSRAIWICDPLDGTTNYVHGLPIFCISIGLVIDGEIQLGLIDAPVLNQTFWAIRGQGAFMNGQPISVSKNKTIEESLLATGFSYDGVNYQEQLHAFSKMLGRARGVRRLGAAAYDLCLVANGSFDGFWEKYLNPWDMVAGSVIVEEAGGRVTDFSGQRYDSTKLEIIASSGQMHDEILENISHLD